MASAASLVSVLLCLAACFCIAVGGKPLVVGHDGRSLLFNGQRRIIISGSIHYPRSTPEYDFEGRLDFIKFLKTVQQEGLYAIVRIGPYVCAEWNYGGLPVWLHNVPGLQMRTNNEAFQYEMATFTRKIVSMMKGSGLLASQGGPVILLQIENEYGNIMSPYGNAGKAYINWAAEFALSLNVSVPWIMCQESDAPAPMINTCNGFYCDQFEPNSPTSPKMWTENWTGWFKNYGGTHPHRPVEDIAYAVARFFQTGGTLQNYYMYHGGTNFDRTAGGPFITTSYDYDAPLDEYGYARQPKWGHLKDLHSSLKMMEKALTYGTRQNISLGDQLAASIYKTKDGTSGCFLSNTNDSVDATVTFNGITYSLPAWSVSILPDCRNVVFNTAKVNTPTSFNTLKKNVQLGNALKNWQWHKEKVYDNLRASDVFPAQKLLEQISTTVDNSDYLWYSISVNVAEEDPFWNNGQVVLRVNTSGHALHVFANDVHAGFASGRGSFVVEQPIALKPGKNYLTLLSVTVGLQNYGAFFDLAPAGISNGPVDIVGGNNATKNLSSKLWMYKTGLKGQEDLFNSPATFEWSRTKDLPWNSSLTWYKAEFEAPEGEEAVVVDLGSMGKGYAWVNGKNIGRYWPLYTAPKNECSTPCDYRGWYGPSRCTTGCGEPTQRWYHVPRSWLQEGTNTLVLFEEVGGEPSEISFQTVHNDRVCSSASKGRGDEQLHLQCPSGRTISAIKFASFGDPQGCCGSFQIGSCHAPSSQTILEKACLGHEGCSISLSEEAFKSSCQLPTMRLAVEAQC